MSRLFDDVTKLLPARPLLRRLALVWMCAAGAMLVVANGLAQDLGQFKAWRSHAFIEGEERVCSMWSQPASAQGKYQRRGEIFAFVTHRPAARNKVSFEMGYDHKAGSELMVNIGQQVFALVTSGSTAWSNDAKRSVLVVRAMKRGSNMVVTGVSARGTKTTDTYSLAGFTAAYNVIDRTCQ
ncbi:MAG: hypothetical protein ACI8PT_001655 [Gammaproteobacteria bacterium]|jgi:hypothetical protein